MLDQERLDFIKLEKQFQSALRIVKAVIGKEEVDYLMEDKPIMLDIIYENTDFYGKCIDHIDYYEIVINYNLLYMSYHKLREVLIHEIIHTFKNTTAHDGIWFYYADLITLATSYNIKYAEFDD